MHIKIDNIDKIWNPWTDLNEFWSNKNYKSFLMFISKGSILHGGRSHSPLKYIRLLRYICQKIRISCSWWFFFSMNQIFFKKMTNVFKKYVVENIYQITDNYVLNYWITYFIYTGWILYVLNCFNFLKNFRPCTMPLLSCIEIETKWITYTGILTRFCHCVEFFFQLKFKSKFHSGHSYCIHLSITAIS